MNTFVAIIKNIPIISLFVLTAALVNLVGFRCKVVAAKISTWLVWSGFIAIFVVQVKAVNSYQALDLFIVDKLSLTISGLVLFIAGIISSYSLRYLDGDRKFNHYFINLDFLIFFYLLFFCANNLAIVVISFCAANFFLFKLMIHKINWQQARNAARLAAGKLFLSSVFLIIGLAILPKTKITHSITQILSLNNHLLLANHCLLISLIFIALAALMQAGCLLPKSWLLSAANTPTPILVMVNSIAVNSGIFILIRFSYLYLKIPQLMLLIFIFGAIIAIIGALWTMVKNDIKHQLTCSTISQIGFILMLYGLGLFYLAFAHLIMHALFKANAFLASSSSLKETRISYVFSSNNEVIGTNLIYSLIYGGFGAVLLLIILGVDVTEFKVIIVPIIFVFFAATQIALPFVNRFPLLAAAFTILFAAFYGLIMVVFKSVFENYVFEGWNLALGHVIVISIFAVIWLAMIIGLRKIGANKFINFLYVVILNSSRSDPATVTSDRKNYIY